MSFYIKGYSLFANTQVKNFKKIRIKIVNFKKLHISSHLQTGSLRAFPDHVNLVYVVWECPQATKQVALENKKTGWNYILI